MPTFFHLLHFLAMASLADKAINSLFLAGGLAALATGLAYGGACLALYHYQTKLIFRPLPCLTSTPADIGIPYEDVWIPVRSRVGQFNNRSDGQLHGWWLPNPESDRTLFFCHGNYGNISYNLERIRFHYNLGFSVLAFDYRGYGQSSGPSPNEQAVYADAEAAWQYLTSQRRISPEKITVMGHSMGGAVAIDLAVRHPDIARLIVKSSFTTMKDAIHAKKIYRIFPIDQLLTEPFDSLSKVPALKMPVLYVHGDQDPDVPAFMSQGLYDASPEPKQLWFAAAATHNDVTSTQGDTYAKVFQDFCSNDFCANSADAVQLLKLSQTVSR